jgi:Tol biopolymer transport system component
MTRMGFRYALWALAGLAPFSALLAVSAAQERQGAIQFQEIVFAVRASVGPHWYENFGFYSNDPQKPAFARGGMLCALKVSTGKLRTLINDPEGGVRDPQVHYDGTRILFSYRKGRSPAYHLYEINVDGTGLKQLTDGPDDDIEPGRHTRCC